MSLHRTHKGQLERACLHCGRIFFKFQSEIARGEGATCGRRCYHALRSTPRADRFWAKVNQQGPEHPTLGRCWLWTAAHKDGKWPYGVLGTPIPGETPELAHRVSWELHYGPIPDGAKVLHHCDNPPCVNPQHLFLGTLKDNTRDMLNKRRHLAKLTKVQVVDIRARYANGRISQQALADEFHVGQSTIGRITRRQNTY